MPRNPNPTEDAALAAPTGGCSRGTNAGPRRKHEPPPFHLYLSTPRLTRVLRILPSSSGPHGHHNHQPLSVRSLACPGPCHVPAPRHASPAGPPRLSRPPSVRSTLRLVAGGLVDKLVVNAFAFAYSSLAPPRATAASIAVASSSAALWGEGKFGGKTKATTRLTTRFDSQGAYQCGVH